MLGVHLFLGGDLQKAKHSSEIYAHLTGTGSPKAQTEAGEGGGATRTAIRHQPTMVQVLLRDVFILDTFTQRFCNND